MNSIAFRLNLLKQRIEDALQQCQRSGNRVQLIAVSKTRSITDINKAFEVGMQHFGENRLQEALPKINALNNKAIIWHFIGRIQSNKVKKIAHHFQWVESIDNEKIAQQFNDCLIETDTPLNVCIQVNIDEDVKKAGVAINEVPALAHFIQQLPNITLRGLMTVPEKREKLENTQKSYRQLKTLFDTLNHQGFNLDTLSMGMSGDFESAILEGSTRVRIGKNLFGPFDD